MGPLAEAPQGRFCWLDLAATGAEENAHG